MTSDKIASAFQFERRILDYLKSVLAKKGKPLLVDFPDQAYGFDAYAPNGLDDDQPAYIEIKYNFRGSVVFHALENLYQKTKKVFPVNVYLVTNIGSQAMNERILSFARQSKIAPPTNFRILSPETIHSWSIQYELPLPFNMDEIDEELNKGSRQLMYLYIKKHRNLMNQHVNFSSEFDFSYDSSNQTVTAKSITSINPYPNHVISITALVGRNGAGKTNICELLNGEIDDDTRYFYVYSLADQYIIKGNFYPFKAVFGESTYENRNFVVQCGMEEGVLLPRSINVGFVMPTIYTSAQARELMQERTYFNPYEMPKGENSSTSKNMVALIKKMSQKSKAFDSLFKQKSVTVRVIFPAITLEETMKPSQMSSFDEKRFNDFDHMFFWYCYTRIMSRFPDQHDTRSDVSIDEAKWAVSSMMKSSNVLLRRTASTVMSISDNLMLIARASQFYHAIEIDIALVDEYEYGRKMKLLDDLSFLCRYLSLGDISIMRLTDGEKALLRLFSSTDKRVSENYAQYSLIILDEPETSLHPELSRRFIDNLIEYFKISNKKIQFIIATHSPFILSDICGNNVIGISQNGTIARKDPRSTFAANINEMMKEELFLDYTIGEFARKSIEEIIRTIISSKDKKITIDPVTFERYTSIVDMIGDDILRNILSTELNAPPQNRMRE